MLIISLDTEAFQKKIETMIEQLEEFPKQMENEMTEWQTEDMNRRYPNTEMPDEKTVQTSIWPTSRYAQVLDKKKAKKMARSRTGARRIRGAQRPILRHHLFDTLAWRMRDLMGEKLRWR